MTTLEHDEFLVIQGEDNGSPIFWGDDVGWAYNYPFPEISYSINIPSEMEAVKRSFKKVKEMYPEYKPFIAKATTVYKTKKYRKNGTGNNTKSKS